MRLDDAIRIRHMIEAAESALRMCQGFDRERFRSDERTYRAVFQCIEVIGEAGVHVGEATQSAVPGVPWHKIVGMRHRLVHAYFDIDLDLVWGVVEKDLRSLIDALSQWEAQRRPNPAP